MIRPKGGAELTYLFVCYSKCTTSQKARKFLRENAIPFEERDIKTKNPTREELSAWLRKSGLPVRKLFNTSGIQYRSLQLAKSCRI
jgi:arsenate reductase